MKNVIINKISRFIFTESQLRSEWEQKYKELPFESHTDGQLMELAKHMLANSSLHDLEHHLIGFGWRDESELEGKMIAENDLDPNIHIEVIDTSQPGTATSVLIDRVLKVECTECGYIFYLENITSDLNRLKCPLCQGKVTTISPQTMIRKAES